MSNLRNNMLYQIQGSKKEFKKILNEVECDQDKYKRMFDDTLNIRFIDEDFNSQNISLLDLQISLLNGG